ncbi:hypothetical protein [Shewanella litorisediminis]|uniref:Uncharacterized protein n=1 Tax=Shewanella litorisediminis TaxID=1173586 RepID=A0ABX7G480_9GAMM|nr:hypothetical protein [Shewanella litorisediminis]MCL2919954.1 hypothetical protein [Shewanella litorisediminis]QRH02129.1 hypothetical protein JQC75_01470 [Shewanella litorisediminis]
MKVSQFFDAILEMFLIALLSVYQIVILILLGWWIIVHDFLYYLVKKVPERLQVLMLPLYMIMLIFGPFYGLAATSLIGLRESKRRLRVLFLDIKGSFSNQA